MSKYAKLLLYDNLDRVEALSIQRQLRSVNGRNTEFEMELVNGRMHIYQIVRRHPRPTFKWLMDERRLVPHWRNLILFPNNWGALWRIILHRRAER